MRTASGGGIGAVHTAKMDESTFHWSSRTYACHDENIQRRDRHEGLDIKTGGQRPDPYFVHGANRRRHKTLLVANGRVNSPCRSPLRSNKTTSSRFAMRCVLAMRPPEGRQASGCSRPATCAASVVVVTYSNALVHVLVTGQARTHVFADALQDNMAIPDPDGAPPACIARARRKPLCVAGPCYPRPSVIEAFRTVRGAPAVPLGLTSDIFGPSRL